LKKTLIFFALLLFYLCLNAQTGGNNIYEFLNLPWSARTAALGSNFVAAKDDDLTLAIVNPSIIDEKLSKRIALTFVDYFGDANYGMAAYSHTFKKVGSFTTALQFINYGKFLAADETGQTYGNFSGGDYALTIGWGRKLAPHFLLGANLKLIYSNLEKYNSFGMAVDVAASYYHEKSGFMGTVLVKNIGRELKDYIPGKREPLPFEVQLGISQKFNTLPIRYSIVYNHLEKFNLTYIDPSTSNVDPISGDTIKVGKFEQFTDKLMRHFVLGAEFYPIKRFYISIGYNYQRRREMRTEVKKGIIGFSLGCGINVYKFKISYCWAKYHLAASPNTITISTNLADFKKKK
jgi:hypothetical protein